MSKPKRKQRKPLSPRYELAIEGVLCVLIVMLAATTMFNLFERHHIEAEAFESLNEGMGRAPSDERMANRYVTYILYTNGKPDPEYMEFLTDLEVEAAEYVETHEIPLDENIRLQLTNGVAYVQKSITPWEVDDVETDGAEDVELEPLLGCVDVTLQLEMVATVNITFAVIALVGSVLAAFVGYYMGSKIEETQAAQKRFFENMSHELKTPVAAIRGYAEGIQAGIVEPEHAASSIVREAKRLRSIVDEIMSLSRLEAGAVKLDTEEVEVADFVEDCLMPFENIAASKNLEVTLDLGSGTVEADEDLLSHALENILSNAFRHAHSFVVVRYKDQMLTVTNDGKMPTQEDVDHLFDRYHSGSTSEGGTGIGLALTKEIVELHGWQIGARLTDENTMEVWVDLH